MSPSPVSPPKLAREPQPLTLDRERLRAVIFGNTGVGKTTLATTFPRPFIVDCEGGLISVALDHVEATVYEPTGYRDMEALYFWLKENTANFDTVIIDTLDGLVRTLLNEVVDQGRGKASGFITEIVPEQAEYLVVQRQIERILHQYRMLGKHIVCTVAVDDSLKRRPALSPGLLKIVDRWSSLTGDLVKAVLKDGEPEQRVLVVEQSTKRDAKSRFAKVIGEPYLVSPTFQTIWSPIEAAYKREEQAK